MLLRDGDRVACGLLQRQEGLGDLLRFEYHTFRLTSIINRADISRIAGKRRETAPGRHFPEASVPAYRHSRKTQSFFLKGETEGSRCPSRNMENRSMG